MSLGQRVRQVRAAEGLTQKEFGSILETSQSHLSEVEKGKAVPSADFIACFAREFPHVDINWLLTGSGNMHSERREYIGGAMPRRVAILRAIFVYIFDVYKVYEFPSADDVTANLENFASFFAKTFYMVAADCMEDLEAAYDDGVIDTWGLVHVIRSADPLGPLMSIYSEEGPQLDAAPSPMPGKSGT